MHNYLNTQSSIKTWAEEDRPREKFIKKGRKALSNAELIGILLGSGYKDTSAVELGRKVLDMNQNDLEKLSRLTPLQLKKTKGIGIAKATLILAAFEIGKRCSHQPPSKIRFINSSEDAFKQLSQILYDLPHEEFHVILLNRANKIISIQRVSTGGISGTVVDARIIFKLALEHGATAIILAHNHPSGQIKPSQSDKEITKRLKKAGDLVEINVIDHIIIAGKGYYSFADEGLL